VVYDPVSVDRNGHWNDDLRARRRRPASAIHTTFCDDFDRDEPLNFADVLATRPAMHSKVPPRNRLAKVLPEEWRNLLIARGVPKRKYTAVLRATLAGGRVIDEMIVEQGWIVALSKQGLVGTFEQRIDLDPRTIMDVQIIQVV